MRTIPVYRNGIVVAHTRVDDEDFEELSRFKWRLSTKGYVVRSQSADGVEKKIGMHQVVIGWQRGSRLEPDHIDRDKLNNQRHNLRLVTPSKNQHNAGPQKNNTSGVRGLIWEADRERWRGQIYVERKRYRTERFASFDDAVHALEKLKASLGVN